MITASVDEYLAIRLLIEFIAADGSRHKVPFIFDTGFSERLSLPPRTIAALGYLQSSKDDITLGDGQEIEVQIYNGRVIWDGQEMDVPIHSLDGDALLGMQQAEGYTITIPARFNETVTFVPLP